jgi:tetratricopeptide (TPR) repeat protein
MKIQLGILLIAAWLAAGDLNGRWQAGGGSQDPPKAHEAEKEQLRKHLEQDADDNQALFELGRILAEEGDFISAGSLFRRYVRIAPDQAGAWAYLLRCAVGRGDAKEAAEAQERVEKLAPANMALHVQTACWLAGSKLSESSQREFDLVMQLASSQGKSGAQWYKALGKCYERAQDADRAERAMQAAIDLEPDTEGNYFRLAHLYSRQGKTGPASEMMNQVILKFPRSVASRVEAGNIELEAGNPERALDFERAASAIDPQFPPALSLLARIQLLQRKYTEAIVTLERAAKLAPNDAGIEFYAGQAWMKTEEGTDRAIEHFKRSLELDASKASTYYWLGSLYFHRKHEYSIAVNYLEDAIQRGPELEAAHQLVIQSYKWLGEENKAAEHLRRYQELFQEKNKNGTSAK